MRRMSSTRFLAASGLAVLLASPLAGFRQDAASLQGSDPPANGIWVDSLDLSNAPIRRGRGQRGSTTPPPPLVIKLGGATYPHALPLQSDGDLTIDLAGAATKFVAMIGVDEVVPQGREGAPPPPPPPAGSVVFGAWVDGKTVFESDVMHRGDAPKPVSIDLANAQRLVLAVIDANDGTAGDSADWAGAAIITKPGAQAQIRIAPSSPEAPPPIAPS